MVFVVASVALLLLGVLAYRRQLAHPATLGLLLLRLGTLLLLGTILAGVRLTKTWTVRPRHVALLLDRSASMAAIRADTLLDRVLATFSFPSRVRRDVWSFADSCRRGNNVPGPNRTRIAAALEQVGRTRPAAVVLVGDGQDNGERSAVDAARSLGVPVHTIGLGALPDENLAVTQVILPASIHAGDTADLRVRVVGTGLEPGPVKVRLGDATRVVEMGRGRTELEAEFRHVFPRPGPQAVTASIESLSAEGTYADNQRTVFADVRPGRYHVVYLTNRPGPETRFVLACLAGDERVELVTHVELTGALAVPESDITRADVVIVDGVVEQQSEAALWQAVLRRVRGGAGVLGLAGPEFKPGPVLESLLPLAPGSAGGDKLLRGPLTPELTSAGEALPWFAPGSGVDLGKVPPFLSALNVAGRAPAWIRARENGLPLVVAGRTGRGRTVFVAGYPLWRWGFGAYESALGTFLSGVVRFLAESDTSPFVLQPDKPGFLKGEPVRLTLRAVGPDGRAWSGLDAVVSATTGEVRVPMTEVGNGTYEAVLMALPAGTHKVLATVSLGDSIVGRAAAEFTVAEQSVELAQLGLNQGLLEAIAAASGGSYFAADSLLGNPPSVDGPASELRLGTYERRLVFEPRRAAWAYVLVALLAGLEWWLRRKQGLL